MGWNMIAKISSFLSSISDWVSALSLIVSLLTLITMLCFNRRIRKALEKKDFDAKRKKTIQTIDSYSGSIMDGIYNEDFLDKIDLYLVETRVSYTFFKKSLQIRLWFTSFCINHFYKKEIKKGSNRSRHRLCAQLRKILVLIRKE